MTGKWSKYGFVLAACFVALCDGVSGAQSSRDGYSWNAMGKAIKLEYAIGFTDAAAWAYGNSEGQLATLKSLSPKDRKILTKASRVWDYGNISYIQLVDAMDSFYADNLNKGIKWDRALSYVRDCIHGEPKDYLETELNFERRLATVNSTGK